MLLSSLDRQVIASWRDKALKRSASGPRIAVIGNCQSFGIAYAMKLLDISAQVDRFSIISKSWTDVKLLARTMASYDYVFSQDFGPNFLRNGTSAALRDALPGAIWFPSLIFTAYHPDLIFVQDPTKGNALLYCPTGPYHSGLVLFAYRAGLPVESAAHLFRRETFAVLGYFDMWNDAAEALLAQGRQFSLDLSGEFLRWTRRGCFMYSINHPKPHVLYDMAGLLLRSVGRPAIPVDFDTYAVDDIVRGYVFPVYPQVAEYYGTQGSYIFKTSHYQLSKNLGEFWDLPGYVRACYRLYAKEKPDALANERVQAWLDDATTAKFLCDFASDPGGRKAAAA